MAIQAIPAIIGAVARIGSGAARVGASAARVGGSAARSGARAGLHDGIESASRQGVSHLVQGALSHTMMARQQPEPVDPYEYQRRY